MVETPDVMLRRIFGTMLIKDLPHLMLDLHEIMSLLDDVMLATNMALGMAVVQLD